MQKAKHMLQKKHAYKKYRNFLIFYMIVFIIIFCNYTLSRYTVTMTSDDTKIQVAIPVITLSNDEQTYTIEDMVPGKIEEYEFQVSNKDEVEQKMNEVNLKCYFTITDESEIPLTFEVYEVVDGAEQVLQTTNAEKTWTTGDFNMTFEEEQTKQFKVKIKWEKQNNSYEQYSSKPLTFNIKLEAMQVID